MNACGVMRSLIGMAFDAVEAVLYAFDDPAERVFGDADRLADTEAEEEVAEPRAMESRTEQGQIGNCSFCGRKDFINATGMCDGLCADCVIVCVSGESSSPGAASAGDDRPGGSIPVPDVEPPGIQFLTAHDLYDAATALRASARAAADPKIAAEWRLVAARFDEAFCLAVKDAKK